MKTICYLRLSTMFTKGLIEKFNEKYAGVFSFVPVDGGYTQIMPRNMQNKSSEQLVKELKTLNNFCNRIVASFKCHVQGIVILEKEQKVIICNDRKINCYDYKDTSKAIIEFTSRFGCYDREIVGTNEMLDLASFVLDLNLGFTLDSLYSLFMTFAENDDVNGYYAKKCSLINSLR